MCQQPARSRRLRHRWRAEVLLGDGAAAKQHPTPCSPALANEMYEQPAQPDTQRLTRAGRFGRLAAGRAARTPFAAPNSARQCPFGCGWGHLPPCGSGAARRAPIAAGQKRVAAPTDVGGMGLPGGAGCMRRTTPLAPRYSVQIRAGNKPPLLGIGSWDNLLKAN